jgi:hypothetical protein
MSPSAAEEHFGRPQACCIPPPRLTKNPSKGMARRCSVEFPEELELHFDSEAKNHGSLSASADIGVVLNYGLQIHHR